MAQPAIKGPASYFPAIEKAYGRPIAEWQELVRSHLPAKHMDLVAMLKAERGLTGLRLEGGQRYHSG